jgi:hypothetical protein
MIGCAGSEAREPERNNMAPCESTRALLIGRLLEIACEFLCSILKVIKVG